jgi:hypothetical protein
MKPTPDNPEQADPNAAEPPPPACVMSFNASDPSGAGGLAGDVATIAAMGAHPLPVVTAIVMRDTAEVFDQHPIEADAVGRAGALHPRGHHHRRLEGRLPRQRRTPSAPWPRCCRTTPTCRW